MCEKFAAKNPSIVAYDEKIMFYSKTIEEIDALPKEKDIDFVRLGMKSVCESMINHCKEWMKCLAQQLNESAKKRLHEIKIKLDVSMHFGLLNVLKLMAKTTGWSICYLIPLTTPI